MALFQKSVLKKFLADLDETKLQQAWRIFKDHFHNPNVQKHIRDSKEEEYQEGFVRDLFVNVLGYTLKPQPDYNFVLEKKTEADATKSDGAMLSFPVGGGREGAVIGVIELKDTDTTELDSIEKQVFGYKHKHKNCTYVITSNFEKLRFYINDSIDYEEFHLFHLTQNEFAILYLCLQQKNIENDVPLKMKQASVAEEEGVTKKLYAEYSSFKQRLFTNLAALNPQYNKLELFKKTQKLLDRFLFILFAEDRLLVPPNSVREILKQWEQLKELDSYEALYTRFKKYFGYLNKGHQGKQYDIYAYNGGLFADDEILDNIKVDDKILYEGTKGLSNYDFESEVDVNILGHIFEHSLSEIEEIQASISKGSLSISKGLQPLANTTQPPEQVRISKRKKDGVFYTPRYITKYIVENTVGELCRQKKLELKITDDEFAYRKRSDARENKLKQLNSYRNWLLELTICDPACGSGAFLNQALEYLIAEHKYADELRAKLLGEKIVMNDMETEILTHNLFGVDINEEAVEIARLSLWLRTAQKGRKLSDLGKNIKCGNSLIDDPAVAGDKAFNWQKEFPTIFRQKEKNTFHITFVTHYSRRSERMEKYKVPHKEGFWMNEEAELLVTGYIKDIVIENQFHVLAYNICGDHVHMLIVAAEEELPEILRKIKGKSSQRFKEHLGIEKEEKFHLWAQKYSTTWLYTQEQYFNTLQYIQNNRQKHELPFCKGLQPLADTMLSTEETAYAIEYNGGFDVVIGNPPYVRSETLDLLQKNYFKKHFDSAIGQYDIYVLFYELAFNLLKSAGKLAYITPNKFLLGDYGVEIRKKLIRETKIEEILDISMLGVFEDAYVYPIIFFGRNIFSKTNKIRIKSRVTTINSIKTESPLSIDQSFYDDNDTFIINTNISNLAILNKMEYDADTLKTNYDITRGFRPPPEDLISLQKKNENHFPFIKGEALSGPYQINWDGLFVNYIQKQIPESKNISFFIQPKIYDLPNPITRSNGRTRRLENEMRVRQRRMSSSNNNAQTCAHVSTD